MRLFFLMDHCSATGQDLIAERELPIAGTGYISLENQLESEAILQLYEWVLKETHTRDKSICENTDE